MKLICSLLLSRAFLAFSSTQGQVNFPDDVLVGNQSFLTETGTNNAQEIEVEATGAENNFDSLERSRRYRIVLVVQPTGRAVNYALYL